MCHMSNQVVRLRAVCRCALCRELSERQCRCCVRAQQSKRDALSVRHLHALELWLPLGLGKGSALMCQMSVDCGRAAACTLQRAGRARRDLRAAS